MQELEGVWWRKRSQELSRLPAIAVLGIDTKRDVYRTPSFRDKMMEVQELESPMANWQTGAGVHCQLLPDFQIPSEGVPRNRVLCMLLVQDLPVQRRGWLSLAVLASWTALLSLACALASFK